MIDSAEEVEAPSYWSTISILLAFTVGVALGAGLVAMLIHPGGRYFELKAPLGGALVLVGPFLVAIGVKSVEQRRWRMITWGVVVAVFAFAITTAQINAAVERAPQLFEEPYEEAPEPQPLDTPAVETTQPPQDSGPRLCPEPGIERNWRDAGCVEPGQEDVPQLGSWRDAVCVEPGTERSWRDVVCVEPGTERNWRDALPPQ